MLWVQTLPALALWLAFIFVRRGWVQDTRRWAPWHRGKRTAAMMGALLVALGCLVGGLFLILNRPEVAQRGLLTPLGIVAVAVIGLGFLHFEMLALALTLSLAFDGETRPQSSTSEPATNNGDPEGDHS